MPRKTSRRINAKRHAYCPSGTSTKSRPTLPQGPQTVSRRNSEFPPLRALAKAGRPNSEKNEGATMRSFKLPANTIVIGARVLLNPARRINLLSLLLSALVLSGIASIAVAQSTNSRVTGIVKDTAGAMVPGAKVMLMDAATKDQKEATTNE